VSTVAAGLVRVPELIQQLPKLHPPVGCRVGNRPGVLTCLPTDDRVHHHDSIIMTSLMSLIPNASSPPGLEPTTTH
jgi:hypothetical protein